MEQSDLLRRIRKLLQLTPERGASEAEAEQAARRVRALLDEHNLSLVDIPGDKEETGVVCGETARTTRKWELIIANSIGQLYDCRILTGRRNFCFIGAPLDVQICHEVYGALRLQAQDLRRLYLSQGSFATRTASHDYMQGIAFGLRRRIQIILGEREVASATITALVVQKAHAITQWLKTQNVQTVKGTPMRYRNDSALYAGIQDANQLQISKQLSQ